MSHKQKLMLIQCFGHDAAPYIYKKNNVDLSLHGDQRYLSKKSAPACFNVFKGGSSVLFHLYICFIHFFYTSLIDYFHLHD